VQNRVRERIAEGLSGVAARKRRKLDLLTSCIEASFASAYIIYYIYIYIYIYKLI